jgi:hypothetical protein
LRAIAVSAYPSAVAKYEAATSVKQISTKKKMPMYTRFLRGLVRREKGEGKGRERAKRLHG